MNDYQHIYDRLTVYTYSYNHIMKNLSTGVCSVVVDGVVEGVVVGGWCCCLLLLVLLLLVLLVSNVIFSSRA